MENVFLHLLNMSLTAGLLVVVVMVLRLAFHKAPRWIHCLLWALVAVRLLCPISFESHLSLMPDTEAAISAVQDVVTETPAPDQSVVTPPDTNHSVIDPPTTNDPVVVPPATDTPVVTPLPNQPTTPESSVSAATPEASVDPWQVAVSIATYVWLAGVALLAVYAVITTLRLRRQVREAARLTDRVWCCDHLRSPFILGVFRPRIYLPSDLNPTARASVLAHEQAHLHRRDHWWKPLGFILLTVYWFNPLMWVAYVLLCRDIESACDERVVRDMTAADRKAYSEALLACSAPRRLVSACPLAFGETSVKSRIKSVLSYKKPTIWIIVAALLISTVAGVCLLTDPKSDDTDKPAVTDTDDDPDEEGDEPPAATTPDDDDDGTTPPPSYPTAFNAQVTGTVLEWHKEEEYLLLKVNPQFSEELGETLKVYTQYAPAGCAPEVGARLRILYGGFVQEGTPNAIYAASLFEPAAYHLIKTGVDLYDNLLKEIADYCYGLAPSAKAPDCSYLIFNEHIDPMFAIGIKVMDLDKNGQNDLLVSAYNGLYGTRDYVYDAYTIKDGKLVHLLSGGERSRYYLHEDGYIEHQWSGGAALSGTDFYRLVDGELTRLMRIAYDADYAVKCGLAADLSSVTEDVAWFHTAYASDGSELGFGHITKQEMQDIITDFAADHPLLNVNFLCLETGVAGSPDDDPPTTGTTTTTPTTPTTPTKPTAPTTSTTTKAYWQTFSHPMPYEAAVGLTGGVELHQDSVEKLQKLVNTVSWNPWPELWPDTTILSSAFFSLDGETRYFVFDDFLYHENAPSDRCYARITDAQYEMLRDMHRGGVTVQATHTLRGYFAEWNKQAEFYELDVVQADDTSLIGKRVWVRTSHLPGAGIPYIGSLLEVSYDGVVVEWYQKSVYAIDYTVLKADEVTNATIPDSGTVNGKVIYVTDGAALMYFDDLEPYDTVFWVNYKAAYPDLNPQIGEMYRVVYDGLLCTTYPVQAVVQSMTEIDPPAISDKFISEDQAIELAAEYWGIEPGSKDMETAYAAVFYVMVMPTEKVPDYVIGLRYVDALYEGPANSTLFLGIHIDAETGEIWDAPID